MNTKPPSLWPAMLSLGVSVLFWSSVPLLLKYFTHHLDPWTVNGMRYLFAAFFWLPYVLRHLSDAPPGSHVWRDALPPALVHMVGQVFFGLTPYFNDATIINFVSRIAFLFTTLFGFGLLKDERPLGRQPFFWIGFAFTVVGLAIMFDGSAGTKTTSPAGMLFLVAAALCWGLYSVLVRRGMRPYTIPLSFGVISLCAAPGLIVLMFLAGDWRRIFELGLMQWILLWVSAVAGIALGHTFFYRALRALGPVASEGGLLLIPFITAVLAFFILGEHMNAVQWTGGVILVLGSLLLFLAKMKLVRGDAREQEKLLETSTAD
ncbi:MAG: DMT family transporter [Lentisphaerota bacterium]